MLTLLTKGLTVVLTKLLATLASEKMIEWSFFKVAEAITKNTSTPHDDAWLEKLKECYK